MAKARRRPVRLGSAESIDDDLRMVRSLGGFDAVLASQSVDLSGTRAAMCEYGAPKVAWLDAWRELRAATEAVCSMFEQTAVAGSSESLGAAGLRCLALEGVQTVNHESAMRIRDRLGEPFGRDAHYVRRHEDQLTRLIGEFVVAQRSELSAFGAAFEELRILGRSVTHLANRGEPVRLLFAQVCFEAALGELVLGSGDGERLDLQQTKLLAFAINAVEACQLDWAARSRLQMILRECRTGEIAEFLELMQASASGELLLSAWSNIVTEAPNTERLRLAHEAYQQAAGQFRVLGVVATERPELIVREYEAGLYRLSKRGSASRINRIAVLLANDNSG